MAVRNPITADTARREWGRRVLRVGGIIQACFAAFWLVRGSLAVDAPLGTALAAALGLVAIATLAYGVRVTAGLAPRPHGPEAARLERAITYATVGELAASFAFPVVVTAGGHSDWVLPSIAITIGPLLLWLDHRLGIPRYRPVGWALTIGPVVLVLVLSGPALVTTTGLSAGALLLVTAIIGFHELVQTADAT